MPQDLEGFENPNTLIEYRGIRGGEKGEKAPIKTPPRVRMPIKNAGSSKFDIDEDVMIKAARRLGVKNPEKNWAKEVKDIPVFLLSDTIQGEDGVVYLERAFYTGRGRLCSSPAGEAKALQKADVKLYALKKAIKDLPKPREVDCTTDCPMWPEPGKKSDCGWRSIVTMQLQDDPVYPSPSRHRTKSKYSNRAMITSLRYIASITGGVLMGLPLYFRQSNIDVKDATGKTRRIPVMNFEWRGTVQELRAAAVKELASRDQLAAASKGEFPTFKPSYADLDLGDGEVIDDEAEAREGDETEVKPREANNEEIELQSKIALLYTELGYTPARRKALETKHDGDLNGLFKELQIQAPAGFDPSPGHPGDEDETPEDSNNESSSDDDEDLDLFD
jgi:hypothetical protein